MTLKNALRKIEREGLVARNIHGNTYAVKGDKYTLEFRKNGGSEDITCIGVRANHDQSDSQSDYCAFTFYDNLTQGIQSLRTN